MTDQVLEVELRARVDASLLVLRLRELGATFKEEDVQDDDYFKCSQDDQRLLLFRIRERDDAVQLTLKGSSRHEQDIAWQEWETPITDADALRDIFLTNGYVRVTRIRKHRRTWMHEDFEINLDEIEGLGSFVEVELLTPDAEAGRRRILQLLELLGVDAGAVLDRGYVALMLEQQS